MRTIALLVSLLTVPSLFGQVPQELDKDWLTKPYQVQLIVNADPHPVLTNLFVEDFARELSDSLQRDLGATAKVQSMVYREPNAPTNEAQRLMQSVVQKGWSELDRNQPLAPNKTHLVRLVYVDGAYEVQSRQVDGDTALVSPLRKASTTDRQWVNRMAALQVSRDFGLTGAVVDVNAQTLRIKMRAAGLGVPETIRLSQGEVLMITHVRNTSNGITSSRITETLAYVTNINQATGDVTARVYTRLIELFAKDKATLGYRVIKLGTQIVPLQLRVVDNKNNPITGFSVSHFPGGFENAGAIPLGATDNQGRISSKEPINHVAFVQVDIAGVSKTNSPIPLLDDQPVSITIYNDEVARRVSETKFEYERWLGPAMSTQLDFEIAYTDVWRKLKADKTEEAVKAGTRAVKQFKEELADLTTKFERVKKSAGDLKDAQPMVKNGEALLTELGKSVSGLEKQLETEVNPTEDSKLLKQGEVAEQQADFPEAIKLYSKSYQLNPKQPRLEAKLKKMSRAWNIRAGDADHQQARDYALTTWSNKTKKLDSNEIAKEIPKAESFLEDLQQRNDYLTAILFLKGYLHHAKTLKDAYEALGAPTEENMEKTQLIEKTIRELNNFRDKAIDFVQKIQSE